MYTLYKFHFLNGISEINQLFDDILIIWPAPVYIYIYGRRDSRITIVIGLSTERRGVIGASRIGHAQGDSHSEIPDSFYQRTGVRRVT